MIEKSRKWENSNRLMYVVGASKANSLKEIRKLLPDSFLLIPGVGAQGGTLEDLADQGLNDQSRILVNSSRGIIYASTGSDFDQVARGVAKDLQTQMAFYENKKGIV